ncbi:hypothetical protein IC619_009885 [Hazenella sp. IB182353]|uniref:hypothetical protein n=1 Tax=Polycladospora coralii TaxID=2771432 RepID=UPI0017466F05|nr:hypothetical protein [Polycladospora coralii]MBS7530799.1 hypothetical protein [Polycladospora coralii]
MLDIRPEVLYQMYVVEDKSIRACANKLYCQPSTVRRHLVLYQIPIQRKNRGRIKVEERLKEELSMDDVDLKEHLIHLRFFQMLSFSQLGKVFNCSASSAQMVYKRYGIETKRPYNRKLTEDYLYDLYVKQGKTILACADILACSHTLIRYYLLKYKIPLRTAGAQRIETHIKSRLGMTDQQVQKYLTELSQKHRLDDLVEKLEYSKGSIRLMYKRLGIKRSWR